ncbi:MAG: ATP-binding cassette domain-containing protein [Candidatus Eisenbacteria bacterium]|nr:ATP-binding cassette domain-containing protein [Candidatus Eisenbacteria bacterium]
MDRASGGDTVEARRGAERGSPGGGRPLNGSRASQGATIRFDRVTFAYTPGGRPAVSDLSLEIRPGESVVIVGPSGSGKSTVLKLLDALVLPQEGHVLVDGIDTRDQERLWDIRRRVGLIFQNPDNQLVSTTVEREIAFGMENLGLQRSEIARRIEEVTERLGLGKLLSRPPHKLSGGEKQRVAVAAVLAMRPACLALDEPTSLLDWQGRREIWSILRAVGDEPSRTVLHVTQFPDEVALGSRALVIAGGELVFDGTPTELFAGAGRAARWGLRSPATMTVAESLRGAGYSVPEGIPSLEDLVDAVARGAEGRAT